DTIVALTLVEKDHLLTISDVGFGKRTEFDDFRGHGRGTMGVKNMQLERDAVVIESRAVLDTDEIIVMTASGVVIRMPVCEIRMIGRGTKGVRTIRLDDKDRVIGVAIYQPEVEIGETVDRETVDRETGDRETENTEPVSSGNGET
ncbi:MAG: DNA gyrase C-terminal beta-propeller domain-containing protein, partial [Methanoregula sp.]|nr:DNA gyrase C-terminal beta-propeller domain-containing protein [Methanoregula sp.]